MLCFPNAKINIGLYVTEKRKDGYHNLETLFYPVPLCDILEIVPQKPGPDVLTLTGLPVPGNSADNLVLKAVNILREDFDFPSVKINLHKIIPMGSGLGGGSADAAFCLVNINRQFNLDIPEEKLLEYALRLGSDCPFFIKNTPQFAKGRGEIMTGSPLRMGGKYLLLVFPGIHISTRDAFLGIQPRPAPYDLQKLHDLSPVHWQEIIGNDFESGAFRMHPLLRDIHLKLKETGAVYSQMSGSGSCVYGIFNENPGEISFVEKKKMELLKFS